MNAALNPEFEPTPDPKFELPIQDYSTFYRFYLTEHRNIMSRRLHVVGSSIGLYCVSKAIRQKKAKYVLYIVTGKQIGRAHV